MTQRVLSNGCFGEVILDTKRVLDMNRCGYKGVEMFKLRWKQGGINEQQWNNQNSLRQFEKGTSWVLEQ
jgi:hypothetical protein